MTPSTDFYLDACLEVRIIHILWGLRTALLVEVSRTISEESSQNLFMNYRSPEYQATTCDSLISRTRFAWKSLKFDRQLTSEPRSSTRPWFFPIGWTWFIFLNISFVWERNMLKRLWTWTFLEFGNMNMIALHRINLVNFVSIKVKVFLLWNSFWKEFCHELANEGYTILAKSSVSLILKTFCNTRNGVFLTVKNLPSTWMKWV